MGYVLYSDEPFFKRLFKRFRDCNATVIANGMVYSTLIAIIPCLAVMWFVFDSFGLLDRFLSLLDVFMHETFGDDVGSSLMVYMKQFTAKAVGLGITGIVSFLFTFLILIDNIWRAINRVFDGGDVNAFVRYMKYILFLLLGVVLIAVIAVVKSRFSSWFVFLTKLPELTVFEKYISKIVSAFNVLVFTFFIYYYLPNCKCRFDTSLLGAFICTSLIIVLTSCFRLVVRYFVRFSVIYGSIAAIMFFLMYICYCWQIVLWCGMLIKTLNDGKSIRMY